MFGLFVDQELLAADEQVLRKHLSICPDCQKGFDKYTHAVAMARSAMRFQVPSDFTSRVLQRIQKRRRGLSGLLLNLAVPAEVMIPAIIALALAAAVVLFLYLS